ncbi:surfactin synthase thioesterase subunit [Thermosporothrix hazakensis]|jgi:surfactin synthase thioesterase subunit|uniref:Surfactin synthase thioesterase subunit n=2 Tax=Thermosporothrix TaxID=768650 RepID=A0A326U4U3_THEHA|nr:alpha/beta fold hydrolase [Thermosporothrix hazakensis]PZW27150.1 surfactin synthase thioesterase subunit [Thermosporothrix hazakensis]BBH88016.1 hypothetical protein KTC_27670 [Thermosporothrix sp. COM3]GCE50434.1 hypothetical protein KTH_53030 [Thermosporothrix hazakensis]
MRTSTQNTKWLHCLKPNPHAYLRLFCFSYAGGSASTFYGWERMLPPEIEVCAIQLPGRENRLREPPITNMQTLITSLEAALSPYLQDPYAFFGHSLGALICFLLAKQLPGAPECLFVSAHRAPHLPPRHSFLHRLSDAELIEQLRTYQGTPESVLQNSELMSLLLPSIRADFTLFETYQHKNGPALTCPVIAFGGEHDPKVSRQELLLWRMYTSNTFELHMLPGTHFFLQDNRAALLQSITQALIPILNRLHI